MKKLLANVLNIMYGLVWWFILSSILISYKAVEETSLLSYLLSMDLKKISIVLIILSFVVVCIDSFLSKSWKKFLVWLLVCALLFVIINFSWFIWNIK